MSFGRPATRTERHSKQPQSAPTSRKSERWEPFVGWDITDYEDEDSPGLEEWTRRRLSPTEQYLGRSRNKETGKYFLEIYPTDRCYNMEQLRLADIYLDVDDDGYSNVNNNNTNNNDNNNNEGNKSKVVKKPPSDYAIQQPALTGEFKFPSRRASDSKVIERKRTSGPSHNGESFKTPLIVNTESSRTKSNSNGSDVTKAVTCTLSDVAKRPTLTTQTWATYNPSMPLNNSSAEFSVYKDVIKPKGTLSPTKEGAQRHIKSAPPDAAVHAASLSAITRYAEVYASMKHGAGRNEWSQGNRDGAEPNTEDVISTGFLENGGDRTFVTEISRFREKNPSANEVVENGCVKTDYATNKSTHSSKDPTQNSSVSLKKISIQEALPGEGVVSANDAVKGVKWTHDSSTVKSILKSQDHGGSSHVIKQDDDCKYNQHFQTSSGFKGGKISADKVIKTSSKKERSQNTKNSPNKTGARTDSDTKVRSGSVDKSLELSRTSDRVSPGSHVTNIAKINEELVQQSKEIEESRQREVRQRLAQAKAHSRVDIASLMEMCREQNIDYFPIGYLLPAVDSNIQSSKPTTTALARAESVVKIQLDNNGVVKALVNERTAPSIDGSSKISENGNAKLGHKGFRGNTNRTPLQRARENTQKRLFGPVGLPRDVDPEPAKTRWPSASPKGRQKVNSAKGYMALDDRLAAIGLAKCKKESTSPNGRVRAKTAK